MSAWEETMSKLRLTSRTLSEVRYKLKKPVADEVAITVIDKINIKIINETHAKIIAERSLKFGEETDSYISAEFALNIESDESISEETIRQEIRKGMADISLTFAKASLVISQLSSESFYGPLVTPPNYDYANIAIE